jgi:hypothetical protein
MTTKNSKSERPAAHSKSERPAKGKSESPHFDREHQTPVEIPKAAAVPVIVEDDGIIDHDAKTIATAT